MSITEQQLGIEDLRVKAEQYKAYTRLMANSDFKLLILDMFMVQQCAASARKSAKDTLFATGSRNDYWLNEAQAAGYLEAWLERKGSELESASYAYAQYVADPESYVSDNTEITIVGGAVNVTRS